jgi:hypothetical protein
VDWDGLTRESVKAAEERARDMLKVYGFCLVTVRAVRNGDGVSLVLTGADTDLKKAKALFTP